jgi:hypothetical protein
MRRIPIAMAIALLAVIGLSGFATAQEATPVGTPMAGEAVDPSLCTLQPLTFAYLQGIIASPVPEADADTDATPAAVEMSEGEPVDAATRQAVEASMRINVACLNTGAPLLQLAIYTDDALRRLFGDLAAITEEQYQGLEVVQPLAEEQWVVLYEFQEMVRLEDGQVAALIVGDDPVAPGSPSATLFFLEERDGHWFVDDFEQSGA